MVGGTLSARSFRRARRTVESRERRGSDRGISLVEVVVAVVLLGTAVVAVLTAVRTLTIGSRLERDHARAQQWLQSASEVIRTVERRGCDGITPANLALAYQNDIWNNVENPPGWTDPQITVVVPIKVWDGDQYRDPTIPATPQCYDNQKTFLQLITLQVRSPDGEIIETVQVVKRD